jgi:hypothetical protein
MSRFRTPRSFWNFLFALPLATLGAGCATSTQTVQAGTEGEIRAIGAPATAADSTNGDLAPDVAVDSSVEAGIDIDSLVAVIRAEAEVPRARSALPVGVTWTPAAPEEGSAVAFQLHVPRGGLDPEAVVGRLAGHVVRFGRLDRTWMGIGAVPIGTYGPKQLDLELRFPNGEVREQTVELAIASRDWDRTSLSVAPRYSSPPPEVQERIADDQKRMRSILDRASSEWLLDGDFEAPRPFTVTAEFGQERVFNGETQSRHTGVDLKGQVGNPVRAAGRGRVVLAGDLYYSGNGVILDHGLGVYTGYFHLSEILVSEGDLVEKGDLIGRAGATGRVTGPHLHWSLWVDGVGQDAGSLLRMDVPAP